MNDQISLQLYTVREAFTADPDAAIRRVADLGYRHVEPYDLTVFADVLHGALHANGVTAPSAHSHVIDVDLDPVLDAAEHLGVATVIDSSITANHWESEAQIVAKASALNAAAKIARRHGIRLGYHNHWWELEAHFSGVTGLEVFAAHLDPDVCIELDVYWAAVGGADPVHLIDALAGHVRFLHVKDGDLSRDMKRQMPAGRGIVEIDRILAAAPDALRIVEFDDYAGDVFDGIGQSIAYLRC
ncbi:sugar phosphate isomerase/epimerase family protein [Rugosimonospora africana]|uniref:Xylose isomerase n=1 Tax=Rugosimonospora africana TaxID=556532 RepID=A0A8J3R0K9_9ACTN|nr:sugar phosphate isomerase/epimerase [Rugosimonospora africana]GIH19373.1 xylose isomerase [Rugosimonospora africana]